MKNFQFNTLILILILVTHISYGQDFLDDLYYSNNQNNISNNIEETFMDSDTSYYSDDSMDYETRIQKFHNPNYQMSYYWDYGWSNPYWSHNWYYPSWSLSYHNYGWGLGLHYGSSWYGGHNWHSPYWAYNWHYPHTHYYPGYYDYYSLNYWGGAPLMNYYYTNDQFSYGHRTSNNTNINTRPNNIERNNVTKARNTIEDKPYIVQSEKSNNTSTIVRPNINNKEPKPNNISTTRPNINNKKPKLNNVFNTIKSISDKKSNSNRNNNVNSNRNNNVNSNRNSNFNSNRNNSSSRPSNNRSRRN